MYVGIIRGSAREDFPRAAEAFRTALGQSSDVKLDDGLATPEVQQLWQQARAAHGLPPLATAPAVQTQEGGMAVQPHRRARPPGGMVCNPTISELETRRAFDDYLETVPGVASVAFVSGHTE
jgi:hypothetical protein